MALTRLLERGGPRDKRRVRRLVVVGRLRPRLGEDAAVHDADGNDSDALVNAQGQKLVERFLIEERVPAREHEDVHVGLAGKPREHRGLVHPGADRADRALSAHLLERRIRTGQRSFPMFIGGVDVYDVDPVEARSLEALLERPTDAAAAVVEHETKRWRADVVGVVTSAHALPINVRALRDLVARHEQTADLRREREFGTRLSAKGEAHPPLAVAVAIEGCGVEVADADFPRVFDDSNGIFVTHRSIQAADRSSTKAQAGHAYVRTAEANALARIEAHRLLSCTG